MEQTATRDLALEMAAVAPVEVAAASRDAVAACPRPQAAETRRLYAADWAAFDTWCRRERQVALPAAPASVATYLTSKARFLGPGALARRAAAIADRHRRAGHPLPGADDVVRGVLRAARGARHPAAAPATDRQGKASSRPRLRASVTATQLARMAARCPGDLAGLRDQALLLLPAAGIGAEQLLALDREHVQLGSHEVRLNLPGPAGGVGEVVALARGTTRANCPVRALDGWLHSSDTRFGPVFRKVDRWGNVEHRRLARVVSLDVV